MASEQLTGELEALAGSVLCVGFNGDGVEALPLDTLRRLKPGGVVLFGRNITTTERTREVVYAIRREYETDGLAPLVAIDQEGGRVARLRHGSQTVPSAMAVAATRDLDAAGELARALAYDLRSIGANVDFAPVADLALAPESTIVGTRAYSGDPTLAARFVDATVRGLQSGGVAATVKHFPGHGATAVDSHVALPVVDVDLETLRARELIPFIAGIDARVCAVMAGHLVVPALDPDLPASLSPRVLTTLLREELQFGGVCFTDCLEMDAVSARFGTARAAVLALVAGADGLVVSHSLDRARAARAAIVDAVRGGELPIARLREAGLRVSRLREHLARAPAEPAAIDCAAIVRKGITLVRGTPALDGQAPINLISFEGERTDGAGARLNDAAVLNLALRNQHLRSELLRVPLAPSDSDLESLFDLLHLQRERRLVIVARRARLHPAQARAIERLLAFSPDATIVCALEPFDAAALSGARTLLCTYGDDKTTLEVLAEVLTGGVAPVGALPVELAGVA